MGSKQNCLKTPPFSPSQGKRVCASMVRLPKAGSPRLQPTAEDVSQETRWHNSVETSMSARTVCLVLCALGPLMAPLVATAQQAGGTVTIGYLGNSSPALESHQVDAFREGLRQFGYVEGQNLVIRYQ